MRSASTGFICVALVAGIIPANNPEITKIAKAIIAAISSLKGAKACALLSIQPPRRILRQ